MATEPNIDNEGPIYIACESCDKQSAINIGGNVENGWQWECTECNHLFTSDIEPTSEDDNASSDGSGDDQPTFSYDAKPFVGQLRPGTREGKSRAGNPKTEHIVEHWTGEEWEQLPPIFPLAQHAKDTADFLNQRRLEVRGIQEAMGGDVSDDDHEEADVVEVNATICQIPLDNGEFAAVITMSETFWGLDVAEDVIEKIRGAELIRFDWIDDDDADESDASASSGEVDTDVEDEGAEESGEADVGDAPFVPLALLQRLIDVIDGSDLRTLISRQRIIGQWVGDGRSTSKPAAFKDVQREFDDINAGILAEVTAIKEEAGLV